MTTPSSDTLLIREKVDQAVAILRPGTHRLRWLRERNDAQGIAVGIRGGGRHG